jgi:predicted HTH domain antitoxin
MLASISTDRLSPGLENELAAVVDTGLYESAETFLADAVKTFLAARPDLRIAVACSLYAHGVFSLGKAAEWSGLDIEAMKVVLHRHDVDRTAPETPAETALMARQALAASGRTAV